MDAIYHYFPKHKYLHNFKPTQTTCKLTYGWKYPGGISHLGECHKNTTNLHENTWGVFPLYGLLIHNMEKNI